MKTSIWYLIGWFTLASVLDSLAHDIQNAVPDPYKWLHFNSLGFVAVFWIGIHIGRHYSGPFVEPVTAQPKEDGR